MRPLHDKLRVAANAKKLRLEDIAKAMGVSKSAAGHWLTGEAKPRMDKLKKLAEVLGVTVSSLVDEDPEYAVKPIEKAALNAFRELPEETQQIALAILANLNRR